MHFLLHVSWPITTACEHDGRRHVRPYMLELTPFVHEDDGHVSWSANFAADDLSPIACGGARPYEEPNHMTKQQAEIAAMILRESVKAMGQVPMTHEDHEQFLPVKAACDAVIAHLMAAAGEP